MKLSIGSKLLLEMLEEEFHISVSRFKHNLM